MIMQPINEYHKIIIRGSDVTENIMVFSDSRKAINYILKCFEPRVSNEEYVIPDLILLDINMPAINGFEFIDNLEANGIHPNGHLKVVMLTGSLNPDDNKTAAETYANRVSAYLNNPLTKEILIELKKKLFPENSHIDVEIQE